MMEKERLEEISDYYTMMHESSFESNIFLGSDDVYWLIEQAEKTSIYEKMSEEYMLEIMRLSEHQGDTFKRLKVAKDTNAHLLEAFDTKTRVHESLLKDYAELKERVQELETQNEKARQEFLNVHELWLGTQQNEHDLQQENKRYREAIKRMKTIPNDVNSDWDYVQHVKSIISELEELK